MTPTATDAEAGQAVYSRRTLLVYDLVVLGISNRFIWKCPTARLRAHYDRHVSANHLDVGVGTGYFLDRCRFPVARPRVALMDMNAESLAFAAARIARYRPERYTHNVLAPVAQPIEAFDSVGVNYLFHCLPGSMEHKAAALDHLRAMMTPGATLFGSTILHDGVSRGPAARRLMRFYNGRGIFSNTQDDLAGLVTALRQRFEAVSVEVAGCVALFSGRVPSSAAVPCVLCCPVEDGAVRGSDAWGAGHFGAPRGARSHRGVDLVAVPGQPVCSPIDAELVRRADPYDDDAVLTGVLLRGVGGHAGLEVKLFYMDVDPALLGTTVQAGQRIGAVQCLQHRYPGITNHVHLEVVRAGAPVDPRPLIPTLR
ncbi:methyltransferase [Nitrogeniibacter mangrovi]|uniref:Methyltransferase n=1 Tax=Nitrogeniibacter mangrovi TaxID=2016596 RepID=A0A6C1AYR9_9RHOO|nr:methyltransferase [Nitrogeniibacter mangrovi]QID16273.1 methyltransferase [Nitrogeniibacter mangrovi]